MYCTSTKKNITTTCMISLQSPLRLTPSVNRSWSAPPHAHATAHARHTGWRHARRHSRHAWPLRLRHRWTRGLPRRGKRKQPSYVGHVGMTSIHGISMMSSNSEFGSFCKKLSVYPLGWPSNSLHEDEIKKIKRWDHSQASTLRSTQIPVNPLPCGILGSYSFWKFKDPATNIARENR